MVVGGPTVVLDDRGRALALAAPLVLTTRSGARRLGPSAVGLAPGPAMPCGVPAAATWS